jgi:hypothetical protein
MQEKIAEEKKRGRKMIRNEIYRARMRGREIEA